MELAAVSGSATLIATFVVFNYSYKTLLNRLILTTADDHSLVRHLCRFSARVCLSVCLSHCVPRLKGSGYRNACCTIRQSDVSSFLRPNFGVVSSRFTPNECVKERSLPPVKSANLTNNLQ